jgi:hypothetical protein
MMGFSADNRKAFAFGGRGQAIVETNERESCGPALGCRDARRELQRIGGS